LCEERLVTGTRGTWQGRTGPSHTMSERSGRVPCERRPACTAAARKPSGYVTPAEATSVNSPGGRSTVARGSGIHVRLSSPALGVAAARTGAIEHRRLVAKAPTAVKPIRPASTAVTAAAERWLRLLVEPQRKRESRSYANEEGRAGPRPPPNVSRGATMAVEQRLIVDIISRGPCNASGYPGFSADSGAPHVGNLRL
jgi:hypothetical protein